MLSLTILNLCKLDGTSGILTFLCYLKFLLVSKEEAQSFNDKEFLGFQKHFKKILILTVKIFLFYIISIWCICGGQGKGEEDKDRANGFPRFIGIGAEEANIVKKSYGHLGNSNTRIYGIISIWTRTIKPTYVLAEGQCRERSKLKLHKSLQVVNATGWVLFGFGWI